MSVFSRIPRLLGSCLVATAVSLPHFSTAQVPPPAGDVSDAGSGPAAETETAAEQEEAPAPEEKTKPGQQSENAADKAIEPTDTTPAPELDAATKVQVDAWVDELGSQEFARRERAAIGLTQLGSAVLPELRRVARETTDPEVRLRAEEIVKQMTRGDLETKIADFLAGKDVDLTGWPVVQSLLGDSNAVRDLFVQLLQTHPGLTEALEGTPRDLADALEKVMVQIQHRVFIQREFPTVADTFAMLLPVVDPNVPINAAYESVLLSVLKKEAASQIRRDAQLSGPFQSLLGKWVARSTLASRDEVLFLGMAWDVSETLPLAVQTLSEATNAETLAMSMQAIARFGKADQIDAVRPFLDDTRPAAELGFANGQLVRTELRDAAMATIALLSDVSLADAGFGSVEAHPVYGFLVDEIGFPAENDAPRKAARAKIDQLLKKDAKPAGS